MPTAVIVWQEPKEFTLLSGAAALDATGVAEVEGQYRTLTVQVSGMFTATVSFEGSVDGTNWTAVRGANISSGQPATSATAPGIFQFSVSGLKKFRARVSSFTSGNVSAVALAVPC